MKRLVAAVALVLIFFGATKISTAAVSEPRVALVIGNSAYDTSPLKNPANDARLIAKTVRELGLLVNDILRSQVLREADSIQLRARIRACEQEEAAIRYARENVR